MASVMLLVEDDNHEMISLGLYNQITDLTPFKDLQNLFPPQTKIGIKNPYIKVSYGGILVLRNDIKSNIIINLPKKDSAGEFIK